MKTKKILIDPIYPYKYNLSRLVEKLESTSQVSFDQMRPQLGISKSTYFADKKLKLEDERSIPESRIQLYALALEVDLTDFLNYRFIDIENTSLQIFQRSKWGAFYGLKR